MFYVEERVDCVRLKGPKSRKKTVFHVPSFQEFRYLCCSFVSAPMCTPMAFNCRRAMCSSTESGRTCSPAERDRKSVV